MAEAEPLEAVTLSEALTREWQTDAHLICYHATDETGECAYMRINKRSPAPGQIREGGGQILTTILVFDYDLHDEKGDRRGWADADEVEDFLSVLVEAVGQHDLPEPTAFYSTKGGARLLYQLTKPIPVEEAEGLVAGLIRDWGTVGLELDPKCVDWTRLFRLPRVIRDGVAQSALPWFVLLEGGPELDPSTVRPGNAGPTEAYADLEEVTGDRPTPEECHDLLYTAGKGAREKMTEWHKTAKTWLQGRDAFDVCFDHKPFDEEKGRNNELTRLIGQSIGMLYGRDGSSAPAVYALFFDAVEQLKADANTPSWHRVAWELVLRLWNAEARQRGAEIIKHEEKLAEAEKEVWPAILARLREAHPEAVELRGEQDAAIVWAMGRLIAAAPKGGLFLMRPDGTYSPHPCSPELLHATIRDYRMEGVIETHEVRNRTLQAKSAQAIINEHAIPVHKIECTAAVPHTLIRERGQTRALVVKVHQLRGDLEPRPDRRVADWLRAIGGAQHEELVEWLSHALDVTRGICALALIGATGAGKNLLVQGIAECFENPNANGDAALGKFNTGLLDNPVIHCEEGIAASNVRDGGRTADQMIRSLVSGGNISIEPKGKDVFHGLIYPRVLITSNNMEVLAQLCGKRDLSDQDLAAIGQRLLYIDVPEEAARFLSLKGNYSYTRGWVAGSDGNQHTLARHILWLYENRKPALSGTGRLLVEGSRSNRVIQDYALRTPAARAVVRSLLQMLEAQQQPEGVVIHKGTVHVVPSAITAYYERQLQVFMHIDLGPKAVARILRLLNDGDKEPQPRAVAGTDQKQRWWKLKLDVLMIEAIAAGYPRRRLEAIYTESNGTVGLEHIINIAGQSESMIDHG